MDDSPTSAARAEPAWPLLDRYLAGDAEHAERQLVEQWLSGDPARAGELDVLRRSIAAGDVRVPSSEEMANRAGVILSAAGHVGGAGVVVGATGVSANPVRRTRQYGVGAWFARGAKRHWAYAAGIAAAVGVALVGVPWSGTPRPAPAFSGRTYATGTGQQATVTLHDGTRVTLAPRSVLRVTDFTSAARTVALEGEAYFDVARADGAPFVVQTGVVRTRVLGTTFLVRHYHGDARVRVAVTAGRVAVSAATYWHPAVTLAAGTVGEVTDSTATSAPEGSASYSGSSGGQLVFRKAPATEVLATLSRWYGYRFRLIDSTLASQQLTAGMSTHSAAEALATLKLLLDVDLTFDGDLVTLVPRRERPARARPRHDDLDGLSHSNSEVGR